VAIELTRILADYVRRVDFKDLPKEVIDFAKKVILDFFGVALAGSSALGIRALVDAARHPGRKGIAN
jgi:2-methylcitrate dehydratase PrpD